MARPFSPERLVLGLAFIGLGVAWLLSNVGRLDLLTTLRTWWPMTLVVWGGLELVAWALERRRSSLPPSQEALK